MREKAIKIKSIQANSLYQVQNGYEKAFKDYGDAMLNPSIFTEWMCKHGMTVTQNGSTQDFIVMKFDYSVKNPDTKEKKKKIKSSKELRDYYYTNGAIVNREQPKSEKSESITYKMLMRSSGKAKKGDCIFIRDNLYKKTLDYITMDLYDKMPKENAKIVELSAYATLITATAIDYIKIPLDNIFVLEDYTVAAKEGLKKVAVKVKDGECYVDRDDADLEVTNTLWDGMGLIDDSIFPEGMNGFIYCRSHFFKSCLFRGSIQQYFKDYYGDEYSTAVLTDMFGRKMAVPDIKVIVTENSLKWIKFIDLMGGTPEKAFQYYRHFMKKDGQRFAIVKTAHKSKWGDLQRSSFQINNSLPLTSKEKLEGVTKTSVDYCNNLKMDNDAFIRHLEVTATNYNINRVLIMLNEWNDLFKETRFYRQQKSKIISRFKKERLQLGKLLQYGDNLTICGNVIAMLKKVTGEKDFLNEGCFEVSDSMIQCYTAKFAEGEKLAAFRSPHNAPNNIVCLENVYPEPLKRYFSNLGDNVIIINEIYTDVQSALNGSDLDTDAVYVTNQKEMAEAAEIAYKNYPTIINAIGTTGVSSYGKDMKSYAKMDTAIASSQCAIGEASDIAQLALSYYYDAGSNSQELEDVFIICSVLAQVSIDSAKRSFEIDVNKELRRIRNLPCMKQFVPKYPRFFAEHYNLKAKKSKKRKKIGEKEIKDYNCPMDIMYKLIDEQVIDRRGCEKSYASIGMLFTYDRKKYKDVNRKQRSNVISIVENLDKEIENLDREDEEYNEKATRVFEDCMRKLKNIKIKNDTMYALIAYAIYSIEKGSAVKSRFGSRLLTVLCNKSPNMFIECFKKTGENIQKVHTEVQ